VTEKKNAIVDVSFGDGSSLSEWDSFTLQESFVDPLGSFEFTATPARSRVIEFDTKLQKGRLVGIKINGHPQATMLIAAKSVEIGRDGVSFSIECKSVLTTLYQGSVDPYVHKKYKSSISIQDAVREVVASYGFTRDINTDPGLDIKIKMGGTSAAQAAINKAKVTIADLLNKTAGTAFAPINLEEKKHKEYQAQFGESAYSYLSRLFSKHGLVLHADALGNLLISKPDYDQGPTNILQQGFQAAGVGGDLMLDGISLNNTNDSQFSEVVVFGGDSSSAGEKRTNLPSSRAIVEGIALRAGTPFQSKPALEIGDPLRQATDGRWHQRYFSDAGSVYKPLIKKGKDLKDTKECKNVAAMIMGQSGRSCMTLRCSVDGIVSATGVVWTVNTIANVLIEVLDFSSPMWILEKTVRQSRGGGQTTALTLLPLGALILEEPFGGS